MKEFFEENFEGMIDQNTQNMQENIERKCTYTKFEDLYVYKISRELSALAWKIHEPLDWKDKKLMGDQFIEAVDSNAANIVEGYGRFHYLDRIKFYYNARASLMESKHWAILLFERGKITKEQFDEFIAKNEQVHFHLNNFINTTYQKKNQSAK